MKTQAFFRILWYNVCMENREMQTSNTEEMVTISRAEYEQLQQENAQLEAKSAKLEEAHTRLEAKLAAREQEQAQVITSLTLQNEWLLEQLKLSRQTMANWLLKASEKWLQPVYDALHKRLCKEPVLHADETTLQVLKEPGRSSTSKSYMWLYRTSGCAKQAIVLYEYQPTRKAEHAEAFLQGFSGWLHADGYQGYLYFDVLPWLNLFLRFCDDWR